LILQPNAASVLDDVRAGGVQFVVVRERVELMCRIELPERVQRAHAGSIHAASAASNMAWARAVP
jgi:hypothetical protein